MSSSSLIIVAIALVAGGHPASPPISCSPHADVPLQHPTSAAIASTSLVPSVSRAFAPSASASRAEPGPARDSTSATSPSWRAIAAVVNLYPPTPTCTSTKSVQIGLSRPSPCAPVDLAVPLLALVLMALSGAIADVTDSEDPATRSR
ncbi:Uncharacterized protein PBTT_00753 [Plasmodiophora brassicae]